MKWFSGRRQAKEKMLDDIENALLKIEASIDSGKKREWTEYEIEVELERTTGEIPLPDACLRVSIETLRQRYRTEKVCSYNFGAKSAAAV